MALIGCKECGKEYSDKADSCPQCGCPTRYNIDIPTQKSEPIPQAETEKASAAPETPVEEEKQQKQQTVADWKAERKAEKAENEFLDQLEYRKKPRKPSFGAVIPVLIFAAACVLFAIFGQGFVPKAHDFWGVTIPLMVASLVLAAVTVALYLYRRNRYPKELEAYLRYEKKFQQQVMEHRNQTKM